MAENGELERRFAKLVGFGEDTPRPKCPVHGVTLSSVFGCTLCDDSDDGKVSTTAGPEEQESYFRVWERQVLEEYDRDVARDVAAKGKP